MDLVGFKKCVNLAYMKNEISIKAVSNIKKLAAEHGLPLSLSVEILSRIEQPNLVFYGATEKSLALINQILPKISIIIPTWNRVEFLCRCIDSILQQSYQNIEIIVVNDCSTDNTAEVIKEKYGKNKKVIYIENETNLGPGGSRQKAYLFSAGEYIIFADDDDYYIEPEFFKKALALFYDYDNLSMVCANSIIFNDVDKSFDFQPLTFCGTLKKEKFLFGFGSKYRKPNSTFPSIYKKSVLEMADFENMEMMNDTSIYMRAACFGDVCMIKDWVGVYWVHETNISKNLPFNFIIENLNEKNNIYELAKKQFKVSNTEWLLTQQMITITYYLNSRRLSLPKYFKLKKWIKLNGGEIKKELLEKTKVAYKNSFKTNKKS